MSKRQVKRITPNFASRRKPSQRQILGDHNAKSLNRSQSHEDKANDDLTYNRPCDSENTNKRSQCSSKLPMKSEATCRENIVYLKGSLKEILFESVRVSSEMKKIREKLESNSSFLSEGPKKELVDFNISSIQTNAERDKSILVQVNELKMQLGEMNSRFILYEEKIKEKSIQNTNLQDTIFSLQEKIDQIKNRTQESHVKNSQCKFCSIF
ncbi:hypothetical protein SteCoe_13598 [Stentor coeruleus]|uniref:Uncharacterized protein n=1 Tax=Stentor coeruleus TaxID=5963 RepID=A0A1R2C7Z1_9CILI|nr:hypothetical protein SteCoe_13598 [Stentor coeruleus]